MSLRKGTRSTAIAGSASLVIAKRSATRTYKNPLFGRRNAVPESCFAIDTELRVIRVLLDDATIKLNRHEWEAALAVLSNADHRVTLARSWVVGARVCGISCSD